MSCSQVNKSAHPSTGDIPCSLFRQVAEANSNPVEETTEKSLKGSDPSQDELLKQLQFEKANPYAVQGSNGDDAQRDLFTDRQQPLISDVNEMINTTISSSTNYEDKTNTKKNMEIPTAPQTFERTEEDVVQFPIDYREMLHIYYARMKVERVEYCRWFAKNHDSCIYHVLCNVSK